MRKSATFAGVRIRTLVCEKKNSDMHHTWRTYLIISKCELVNIVSPLWSRTSPYICVSHIEFVGKSLWPMYLNKICWSSIIYFGFLTRVFCRFWVLNSGGSIHYTLALTQDNAVSASRNHWWWFDRVLSVNSICRRPSWTPKTQPNNSIHGLLRQMGHFFSSKPSWTKKFRLSFWCSTRPSADTGTN